MQSGNLKSPVAWVPDFELNHHSPQTTRLPPQHVDLQNVTAVAWIADLDENISLPSDSTSLSPQKIRPYRPDIYKSYVKSWIADLNGAYPDGESVASSGSVAASLAYTTELARVGQVPDKKLQSRRFWITEQSIRSASHAGSVRLAPAGDAESLTSSGMRFVHPASVAPKRREVKYCTRWKLILCLACLKLLQEVSPASGHHR